MKQGWEIKNFEDCLDKVVYTNKIQRKDFLVDGEYPIISQEQDFINGYWNNSDDLFEVKKPIIIFGDHTQVLKYVDFDFVLGADGVKIFQTKNGIEPRYFYYLLKNLNLGSLGYARHYRLLKEIEVCYPKSLSEQQQIVTILDKAFATIAKAKANAEQNLKNAKELFESYLQNVFENKIHGNQSESLENLCELIVDCEHKTAPTQDTGYPSIRTPNIGKGILILDNVNRVSEKIYKEWTRRAIPQENDLILAREAPAGNVAVIPKNLKVCLGQRTVLIRTQKDKLNSKYLASLLLSKDVQEKLLAHSRGAIVTHINMKDIRAFKIYNLSSLKEQQAVLQRLDALLAKTQKLEAIYQQKINDLEELKKSILQKAFEGKLSESGFAVLDDKQNGDTKSSKKEVKKILKSV
jgi:type I restriction enzyme S subunit